MLLGAQVPQEVHGFDRVTAAEDLFHGEPGVQGLQDGFLGFIELLLLVP